MSDNGFIEKPEQTSEREFTNTDLAPQLESLPTSEQIEQKQVKISESLHLRLVQTFVIESSEIGAADEDEMVPLPEHQQAQFLNGYTFARYMIALKLLVKQRQNQDLNFDITKLLKIKAETEDPFEIWNDVQKELDKTGITIDEEVMQLLAEGDPDSVNRLYLRLERYMKILCGPLFLNFEDSENVFENLPVQSEHLEDDLDLSNEQTFDNANDQKVLSRFIGKAIDQGIESDQMGDLNPIDDVMISSLHDSFETINATLPNNIQLTRPSDRSLDKPQQLLQPRVVTDGVDIVTLQTDRNLNVAQNSLEFLLVTLSRAFELTPRQSAALLTNNNQYLVTACVKGIKGGNYQPIISWYREVYSNVLILAELLQAELLMFNDYSSIQKVLATVAAGIYSTNPEVVNQTLLILIECFTLFQDNLIEVALSWFLSSDEGGLKRAINALLQHSSDPATPYYFVQLCNVMCTVHEQIGVMYKDEIQNHCRSTFEYIQIISEIMGQLKQTKEDQVIDSGLVDYWLDLTAREAENDGIHTLEERIASIALMTEIWFNFTDYVGEVEDRANTIVFMLKRACREPSRIIKLTTAASLFKLLDIFSRTRNQSAPFIYKTLVFNIVESPGDLTLREFYFTNFIELFKAQPSIPIALLIEPLFKQVQTQIGITYHLKTIDYDFFSFISTHQNLGIELALSMMDLLSKLCLGEVIHCSAVAPSYYTIMTRFKDEKRVETQVLAFAQMALQQLYEIELSGQQSKDLSKFQQRRSGSRYNQSTHGSQNGAASSDSVVKDQLSFFKKQVIYTLIAKLQNIESNTIQNDLCDQLKDVQQRMIQSFDSSVLGATVVDQLLQFYGPIELIVPKLPSQARSRSREVTNRLNPKIMMGDTDALVPFTEKSSFMMKKKVMLDIERIKKLKSEKEEAKKLENENAIKQQDRRKTSLKRQIQRRRIELGVAGSSDSSFTRKAILQTSVETPELKFQSNIQSQVQWYDLDDEEDVDKQAVQIFMKKFSKLWRMIFSKYANIGFKVIPLHERGSFEGLTKSNESITLAEITKLVKDHNLYPNLLSKDDLNQIYRLVNNKAGLQSQPLDFARYLQFLIQSGLNAFKTHQSPVEKLKLMVSHFEKATRQKGLSAFLYEDNEVPESETMLALNQKLKEDPSYPIPEGFVKVREKVQVQAFKLSTSIMLVLNEAQQVSVSLIDELLTQMFGFHVLEPFSKFEDQIKVKPVISKPPPRPELTNFQKGSGSSARPQRLAPLVTPNKEPPSSLLLSVEANCQDKDLAHEIAKILDLLITVSTAQDVDALSKDVVTLSKDVVAQQNQALQQKKDKELKILEDEQTREQKRKDRDQKIKVDLEKLKLEKAERDEKLAQEKLEVARKAKITEKKRQEAARNSINKVIEETVKAREAKQTLQDSKSQVSKQQKPPSKLTKEQIQKQRQSHKDLMTKLSAQNSQLYLKEEEAKTKEAELRDQIKKKSEQQLISNRMARAKDAHFQSQLEEFIESEPVAEVFTKYERFLDHMFKFYCKQAKVDISKDMSNKANHMELREFSKFGYQTKIVPVMLNPDQMVTVFRVVEKWQGTSAQAQYNKRNGQETLAQLINMSTFKNALVRICIISSDKMDTDASKTNDSLRQDQNSRIKEILSKREFDKKALQQQVMQEMRQEFDSKMVKKNRAVSRSPSQNKLISSQSETALQDDDFQKWVKQQESLGNGLLKRFEQKLSNSPDAVKVGFKQSKVQNKIDLFENMGKVDIRDNRSVQREMDINQVSAQSIERLLKFIGLQPGTEITLSQMDQILNAQRVEISGQKPRGSIKRLMLPQLAMGSIQEQEDEQRVKEIQLLSDLQDVDLDQQSEKQPDTAKTEQTNESQEFYGAKFASPRSPHNIVKEDLNQLNDEVKVHEEITTVMEPQVEAPKIARRLTKVPKVAEVEIPKTANAEKVKPNILEDEAQAALIERVVKQEENQVEKASEVVKQLTPLKSQELKEETVGVRQASLDIGAIDPTEQEQKKYETETAKNPQHITEVKQDEEQ